MAFPDPSLRSTLSSDPTLSPFLAADFSPITYLNSTLPSWTPKPTSTTALASTQAQPAASSLIELSTTTQTQIAQLDAKLARLSHTLTQLTDDILRAGGRLSYEVEILQGDAATLGELLSVGLKDDLAQLVDGAAALSPTGLVSEQHSSTSDTAALDRKRRTSSPTLQRTTSHVSVSQSKVPRKKPDYMNTLHMLNHVRTRLDSVTKVFDAALNWPLSPSSLPLTSQFVSVAAPAVLNRGGKSAPSPDELEAKGKAWEEQMREEIMELIEDDVEDGRQAARDRVSVLKALCVVWKGTVEEKPRVKLVESLERLVEEQGAR